jgi:hypothetical protein
MPATGQANNQLPFGVFGSATPQSIPQPGGESEPLNITGTGGVIASSQDVIDDWIELRSRADPTGNVGVLGASVGRAPDGDVIKLAFGFLAGTEPTFHSVTGVYGESTNHGVVVSHTFAPPCSKLSARRWRRWARLE